MTVLWIMNPTYTHKRHFFIIENDSVDVDLVIAYFEKNGYIVSKETESWELHDDISKLRIRGPLVDNRIQYYGGAVYPKKDTVMRSYMFHQTITFFGALFAVSALLFIFLWIAAFIAGFLNVWSIVKAIDLFMPYVIWWAAIINPSLLILLYLLNDWFVARNNQKEYRQIHHKLIDILTSFYPQLTIISSDIATKLTTLRAIQLALPPLRFNQLKQLGFHVDSCLNVIE